MLKAKNDANAKARDLGKGHLATKRVLEEIDQSYKAIEENQSSRESLEEKLDSLKQKRSAFPPQWKNSPDLLGSELPVLFLNLQLKYEVLAQEKMEMKRKEERQANQNRLNEMQIKYLQE